MQFLFHKKFQLNTTSFNSKKELLVFSKSISMDIFSFLSDFLSDSEKIKIKTSGSTGVPKIIEIKKKFMINSAMATGKFFNLKVGTTALLCMNSSFIAGKMMLVRAMVLGWKLDVVMPSLNPLQNIKKQYDFCAMVPIQVHHSFNNLDKIKKLIIGGGALSKELETKMKLIKTACFITYGMTETVSHIAVKKIENSKLEIMNEVSLSASTSVSVGFVERSLYTVLPNIKISQDNRGCLIIDAPKVAENKVITNDLVALVSDTEFYWLGRYDNIINSGGIKLIPEQIEKKLVMVIEERFFVVGIKDSIFGEKLALVVEKNGALSSSTSLKINSVEKSYLLNKIKKLNTLSKYEIPKEIYFVEQFVETDTKKIQRKKTLNLIDLS